MHLVPSVLRQRSSWPSSLVTGLIGWNGSAVVVPLALGYSGPLRPLLAMASLAALAQVLVLRLGFFALRMDRGVLIGGLWGGLTGGAAGAVERVAFEILRRHPFVSLATAVYVGIAVGAFLSYFHRDDRRIEAEARSSGKRVDYGRDAHWLDPFVYGAVAYLLGFTPRSLGVAISAAVVGSIIGVVAAGVSHFILSRWQNASWTVPVAVLLGAGLGAATGLLFRNHQAQLLLPHLPAGAVAGALTFAATAAVGRVLAFRERASEAGAR